MSGKKVLLNENKYGLRLFLKQALLVFGSAVGCNVKSFFVRPLGDHFKPIFFQPKRKPPTAANSVVEKDLMGQQSIQDHNLEVFCLALHF